MQKNFSFKGINRSTDVVVAQDGECLDVINMRMSNGSMVPMPQPVKVADINGVYSAIYWHEIAACHIGITDGGVLHFYDKDFRPITSGDAMLAIEGLQGVKCVEFIGNVACCLTGQGIHYLLFEKGTYRSLGERPGIPDVDITVSSKVETIITEETYYSMTTTDELEETWNYNEKGYIEECVAALNKAGHYVDRALFRVALRLYDGSYINVSNIIYVSDEAYDDGIGRDGDNMLSEPLDGTMPCQYKVRVRGFKPEFSFDVAALEGWRNIVVGVDIFSTMSIPGKKCELGGRTQKFELYTEKPLDTLWEDIASASLFYKIAEYDIDGKRIFSLDDVSPVNLALQQGLETAVVPSSLSGYDVGSSYVYNGRLHIAAFREYFFKGYNAAAYLPASNAKNSVDAMVVQVKLRTTQGDFVTGRYYDKPSLGHDGYAPLLPAMLTYPDSRACEMGVFIKMGETVYKKVFPLMTHHYLNMAYYLHKWYLPCSVSMTAVFANGGKPAAFPADIMLRLFNYETGTHEVVYSASRDCWMYDGDVFPPEEYRSQRIFAVHRDAVNGDKLVFTIKREGLTDFTFRDVNSICVDETWEKLDALPVVESNPCEERRNVMKVSMAENPFVFPAKCTYTPSQSGIIGLCGNTVELSQGQFGQFPLYVFCNDGIWAMAVDSSGSVAYLNCNQVSRDICVNAASICGIGGGVVFAAPMGMMLVAGNSVKKFSVAMDSKIPALVGVHDDIFNKISSLVSLEGSIGGGDCENLFANAFVCYLPAHGEIIIGNTTNDYSLVYSFASATWTRFKGCFMDKVKGMSAPRLFAVNGGVTTVYSIPDDISGNNRVLLFTRPQIWGTKLPKRIMQLLLHAYVEQPASLADGVPLLGCYVLGSNDGVHFKLIAGSEKRERAQDVLFPMFPTQSYKYFLFALVGDMGKGSVVTAIEADVAVPWRNRLR